MTTDALNPDGDPLFVYPRWTTLLENVADEDISPGGEPPPDYVPPNPFVDGIGIGLTATRVVQSAGGQSLDYADLEWAVVGDLINREQPASFARKLEVELKDDAETRIHFGDYCVESEEVNPREQKLTAQSQLRGYHFGDPLQGERWWSTYDNADVVINGDITFNPQIDNRVLPNMSDKTRDDNKDANLWVHPEATLTPASKDFNDQEASFWTLEDAVKAVCWACNTAEEYIDNAGTVSLGVFDGAPTLESITLPRGRYLPYYLDMLLHPLGYNWYVDHTPSKPRLEFFQKGVGAEKEIYHQGPGEIIDPELSNCNAYYVSRTIGDNFNCVRVVGDVKRREVTLPLYPAWESSDDSLTAAALTKSTGGSYVGKETVHRLWVANEAGDYSDLRTTGWGVAGDPPDLSEVFPGYVPHRRNIYPPLTYLGSDDNKDKRDVLVEISTDGGTSWKEYTGTVALMPDRIGILFTNDEPPTALISAGSSARVRITGTVPGDQRIEGVAYKRSYAVNAREVWLDIDAPQKWQDQDVQREGDFESSLSSLYAEGEGAAVRDDTDAIQDYAERLRDNGGFAELYCQFTLPGIHLEYEIGDLLTNITGREVTLNQASSEAPDPVYVQVVKREFVYPDGGSPVTILTVDRGTRYVPETRNR